jgi:hypothetical protein
VKIAKINGVSWLEITFKKCRTINIYNTCIYCKIYKLRKQTVPYLQNVQCLYLQKLHNEVFPCRKTYHLND